MNVRQTVMVLGGELHADEEARLIEQGAKEIARARELLSDAVSGGHEYGATREELAAQSRR